MYNANNYGYNPYGTYIPQRPMPQPIEQNVNNNIQPKPALNGKQVESLDVVKAMDIPMDGTISYFPIADGSAIVTKQLPMDGTSKIMIYKPTIEDKKDQVKFLVEDDLEDLKDDIKDIKKELKELKKKKKDD